MYTIKIMKQRDQVFNPCKKNSYKYRKVKIISSSCFVNYLKLKNINTFKTLGK